MIWSLEEGDNVAPLLAFQKGGKSWFERFESHTYEEAVNKARERFEAAFLDKDDYALLAFDGYLTHEEERKESLFISAFENLDPEGMAYLLTVSYRSARSTEGLAIEKIKIFLPGDFSDRDTNLFLNNLYQGAYSHTKGFELWNNHRNCNLEPIWVVENDKQNKLLGTWIQDPKDTESIRRFRNVKLHFTADGQLVYTILGDEKDQKIFLTYRVENNILITDQPSDPREERTKFRITADGKLEQEFPVPRRRHIALCSRSFAGTPFVLKKITK